MHLLNLKRNIVLSFFYIFRNRQDRTVYFQTMDCKYSDNQRAISEALFRLDSTVNQVWFCSDLDVPSYVKCVNNRIEVLKALAQSQVWVLDLSFSWKPKSIFNIATWHGDRGFKKVIYDNDPNKKRNSRAINGMDLFLSGSRFGTEVARSAFRYEGDIQEVGCPRNDKLVHCSDYKNEVEAIKQKLGLPLSSRILLYAPTFRDDSKSEQPLPFNSNEILNLLERTGEEWFILVRAHHCSKGIEVSSIQKIRDVSSYSDMADLLLVTDLLITDYSSCCCDFVLTERPCILLHYDEEEYTRNCRQYKVTPEESGFCIAKNENELISLIKKIDTIDFKEKARIINRFYGTNETGRSAEITAKKILKWIK